MKQSLLFFLILVIIKTVFAGLYKSSDLLSEIPLKKVVVHSKIKDTIAEVYLQQTYINNSEETIEAIYKFPLSSKAVVESFEADIDGQSLHAKIYKNDEDGNMAFLLDEEYRDVFQVSVGNLKPKQTVHIKLTYVTELNLEIDNDKVTFVLPNEIAPEDIDGTLDIDIDVAMYGRINTIESPSHEIEIGLSERRNNEATVQYSSDKVYLEKDFIVEIGAEKLDASKVLIEYNEELKSYASLLSLTPKFSQDEKLKVEIIFLIDQSGSMHGWKLDYLKDALNVFLKSMPVNCYFNIIKFGSTYESLFEKSIKYNEESLNKAVEYIKSLDASMGGTEMKEPLEFIFNNEIPEGYKRSIFLLTDGEITEVEPVLDLVRENTEKQNAVLYTFGIGSSVSHHLISSIARNGNGMSLFVTEGERLEKKVLYQLKNVLTPYIQDYSITWAEKENSDKEDAKEQTSFKAPIIRKGSRYVVYTITEKSIDPSPITLNYKLSDGSNVSETIKVKKLKKGKLIHSLAAAHFIEDLQEGPSEYHYSDEYKQRKESDEQATKIFNKIKEKIVELSLKYQIMSQYTSFLCTKETETETEAETEANDYKKVIIPSKGIPVSRDPSGKKPDVNHKKRAFSETEFEERKEEGSSNDNEDDKKEEEISYREKENEFDVTDINIINMLAPDQKEKEKSQRRLFNQIIKYQNFDGSFKVSDLLDSIIGPIYGEEFSREWRKELDGIKSDYQESYSSIVDHFDKLVGTSIASIIIQDYLKELKSEWELVVEKSEKWVAQQQQQEPIKDIRQKILLSVNQKKEKLLESMKVHQNKEDGSITFTEAKDAFIRQYFSKVVVEEWSKELEEIKRQVLPSEYEEFNKYVGSVLAMNVLMNVHYEREEALHEKRDALLRSIQKWVDNTMTKKPFFYKFYKEIQSSLRYNKKRKSMIVNDFTNWTTFTGDKTVINCHKEFLYDKLVKHQAKDGSFPIYSILESLRDLEGYEGPCKQYYKDYSEWVKQWFIEVNSVIEQADKEKVSDEEKQFINALWGTLIATHIQEEIVKELMEKYEEEITDEDAFKLEYLYKHEFDMGSGWTLKAFTDEKYRPLISKWWTEPIERLEKTKKEEKEEKAEPVKTEESEKTKTTQKAKETGHDEL